MYQSVVSRPGKNGGSAHSALPPVPSGERVTVERAAGHDTMLCETWKDVAVDF